MTTYNYDVERNNDNFNDRPIIFALIIVCIITLTLGMIHTWYDKTHYSNVAFVDSISDEEVILVDSLGDEWAVDSIPNAVEGDLVEVHFYNNGTDYTHTDDVITHVFVIDYEREVK